MTLRTPNNPLSESVLLGALPPLLAPNTQLALGSPSQTGIELFYVQRKYDLCQGSFPAVLLSSGQQEVVRCSLTTYCGTHSVFVDYCDRWDRQSLPIDTIRLDIAADLERMKANIETYLQTHQGLTINATLYPISILAMQLSGYTKAIDVLAAAGFAIGFRRLVLTFNLLPYSV